MKLEHKISFDTIEKSLNIAEDLEPCDLTTIAQECIQDFKIDRMSRSEWDTRTKEALEIAKQITRGAAPEGRSNVKYPLITVSAIQFASRSYPEFIRNGRVVNCATTGQDPDGSKEQKARRVSDHMSWQMLIDSPEWELNFDKLLHVLPIIGTLFTKTYYDEIDLRNCSDLCLPDCLFVNQYIKSVKTAPRISHITYCYENELIERMRYGLYCDKEEIFISKNYSEIVSNLSDRPLPNSQDSNAPRPVLEQHRFLDLDGDGYQEPYIVTIDLNTATVLRIYRRFEPGAVDINAKGKIKRIIATQYFTAFHFIPSSDGTFMSYGFGQLLLPINETINSTINQLLDAGTLSNRQAVFLAREVRLQKGIKEINPGDLITTDCPAEYLKNGIVPLPVRDPSSVLFQLLGQMVESGQQLSSITDVLQGQIPTQNSSPTTVLAMVEQGLKPFSAIQKRLYRSLKTQFEQWFDLNAKYLDPEQYFRLENTPLAIAKEDYQTKEFDIFPVADPSMSSDAQRLARAQALMSSFQLLPALGQQYALELWMDALQFPQSQIMRLVPPPNPNAPPPPETVKIMAESDLMHAKSQKTMLDTQIHQMEVEIQNKLADVQQQLADIKQQEVHLQAEAQRHSAVSDMAKQQLQANQKHVDVVQKQSQHNDDVTLQQQQMQNDQQMQQQQLDAQPSPSQGSSQ